MTANIIAQRHWPEYVNDSIALVAVIGAAYLSLWLNGQLDGSAANIVDAIQFTAIGLLASTMSPLNKYVQTFFEQSQNYARDNIAAFPPPKAQEPPTPLSDPPLPST